MQEHDTSMPRLICVCNPLHVLVSEWGTFELILSPTCFCLNDIFYVSILCFISDAAAVHEFVLKCRTAEQEENAGTRGQHLYFNEFNEKLFYCL